MAANRVSSGVSCVPLPCGRTLDGGINGFAISRNPSGTIQLQVPRPTADSTSHRHITVVVTRSEVTGVDDLS
jgi:hypothetical protein